MTRQPIQPESGHADIHTALAPKRQVAVIWSMQDVQSIRPDLTDDQAWGVLQRCRLVHDCETGFNWLFIEAVAGGMYPQSTAEGQP